jgi:hypothetical protein
MSVLADARYRRYAEDGEEIMYRAAVIMSAKTDKRAEITAYHDMKRKSYLAELFQFLPDGPPEKMLPASPIALQIR